MASKKKSAIQARQGHPTGIIDDTAKKFGKAASKAKDAVKVAASATKKGEKFLVNREARKQYPRKFYPNPDERTVYRDMVKRNIREEGGILAYGSPRSKKTHPIANAIYKSRREGGLPPISKRETAKLVPRVPAVKPKPAKKRGVK